MSTLDTIHRDRISTAPLIASIALAVAFAGTACSPGGNGAADHGEDHHEGHDDHGAAGAIHIPTDVQERFGIATAAAGPGTVTVDLALPGEIVHDVDRIVHVRPRFAGVIQSHTKDIGEWVRQGETLVTVESNEGLANYAVKAPIAGMLVDGHAHPGEAIGADQELYTISDTRQVWVELQVFPRDLTRVREGQAVRIEVPGVDRPFAGTISFVNPTLSHGMRSATARIVLANPDGLLRPGLFVTGHVTVDRQDAPLTVPASALIRKSGGWVVFVRKDGERFAEQAVVPGLRGRSRTAIRTGLEPGTPVVTNGAFLVKSAASRGSLGGGHSH